MYQFRRSLDLPSLEQVLEANPVVVAPDILLLDVIAAMSQAQGSSGRVSYASVSASIKQSSCALIVEAGKLVGILTEGDLVRLAAKQLDLAATTVASVMVRPVKTLKQSQCTSILVILSWFRQHDVRHLPVLDQAEQLVGVVTLNSIRQALKPLNFFKSKTVLEVMTSEVTKALPQDSLLHLARLMKHHRVSCVVICHSIQSESNGSGQIPLGIVTEKDIVQFQTLGLDFTKTKAATVMSKPLFPIQPQDSLWLAQQQMQQHHIRRLVVKDKAGKLTGIVTQTDLLGVLNSIAILGELEELHQAFTAQTAQLEQTNQQLQQQVAHNDRLKLALQEANLVLNQQMGSEATQLIETNSTLQQKIREHQDSQALLQKNATELKAIFTQALDAIVILDDRGRLLKVNPAACKLFALSESELVNCSFPDLAVANRQSELVWNNFLEVGSQTGEIRIFLKDGTPKQIEYSAIANFMPQRHLAILRDITQRQQERDFTNAILNTVGALVTVLDRQGRIIRFNHHCEQVTDYSFEEVKGRPIWDFLLDSSEKQVIKAVFERLLVGQLTNRYENHWLAKDGSRHLISWTNTALFDSLGQVEFIIATGIDISEQRRVHQKLEHQYRQTHLLAEVTRKIRMSIQIDEILQTTVTEVQHLLNCDRVMIVELLANGTAVSVSEAVLPDFPSMLGYQLRDPLLVGEYVARYRLGKILALADVQTAAISPEITQLLNQFAIKAKLVVPIISQDRLYGLLVVHQCSNPRQWQSWEIELLQQLADQISVALSQAQLLNNLEELVSDRTSELTTTNQRLELEIRDRKLTEIALRENQQKLAGILDNADEAIISINEQQHIQLFNQGAEQIFGYRADEVMGRALDILLPKAFWSIHRQHIRNFGNSPELTRTMAERSNRVFGRRKNGVEFPAEASISQLHLREGSLFTVMLKDITERLQAEQAIRRSEQQMRLITDALPLLIAYVDKDLRYRFNNQAYENWFGKTVAEIEGCYMWEVLGAADYQQIRPYIEIVLSGRSVTFELEVTDKNNNLHWIDVNYIPDFSDSGTVKGFFAAINDITERKAIERMKGEFVSVASHEMRTPLTSIHGVLKLIAAGHLGEFSPRGKEMIEIALRNSDRLVRLINDVLNLERMESGKEGIVKQKSHTKDLIQQAADTMKTIAQEQQIVINTDTADIELLVDRDRILQTLTNLLSNAIKFSPAQSTIWVTAKIQGDAVLFAVKDCGRGIPADKLETIFERFQQIDASDSRKKGGTGLGLAICRHIIQQHQGEIWVESTLGQGSTFYFTVPQSIS